jgi:hypothetical protein
MNRNFDIIRKIQFCCDYLMTPRNYLFLLTKYDEYKPQIERLLESIITALSPNRLENSNDMLNDIVQRLHKSYPFVELIYCLNAKGTQITHSAAAPKTADSKRREPAMNSDRSNRIYYTRARDSQSPTTITQPYLSSATHQLAISAVQRFKSANDETHYLVINFNLEKLITFLNGDSLRRILHPFFQSVYGVIGVMLVVISTLLLFSAGHSLYEMIHDHTNTATQAFQSVILVTLGLAIFDLGKTILEEEVLLHKDIHHSGSTRRTISRFMSAIVIAVSIESLLLMFKSLLGDATHLHNAVWMLFAAVALLVGLGAYLKLTSEKK